MPTNRTVGTIELFTRVTAAVPMLLFSLNLERSHMKTTYIASLLVLAFSIGGCATNSAPTGSTNQSVTVPAMTSAKPVKAINFSVAPEGKQSVTDNQSFVLADLEKIVSADLLSKNLINSQASDTLEVQITKVRVKHGATAYIAGPWAGADEITAKVMINGAQANAQIVSATFTSMGGIFGTNKAESRLAAMHKEFTEKLMLALVR
jgi:hypothetical protein